MRLPAVLHAMFSLALLRIICIAVGLAVPIRAQQPTPGRSTASREIRPDDYVTGEVLSYIQEGQHLANREQYDEAIAAYKSALQKAGRPLFSVYLGLGAVYLAKADFKSAVEIYKQAIALRPSDSRPHFNLGEALYNAGDFRAAESEYRKTLELAPNQPSAAQAHQFIALCLYNQKQLDAAIAEYKVAIEMRHGNYAEAHYNLGIAYMDRGDNQAAETEFRTAIQNDKGVVAQDHYNLGVVLEREKRPVEAADEYEKYLQPSSGTEDPGALRLRISNLRKHR